MLEANRTDGRSVGELFGDLSRGISELVRQEIALAKTELSAKAARAGKSSGMVAAGGALAHAGFLAVVAGVILGLGTLIPLWISALIVGAVIIGVGYAFIQKNLRDLKRIDPAPRQTIATLKENAEWAKEQTQ